MSDVDKGDLTEPLGAYVMELAAQLAREAQPDGVYVTEESLAQALFATFQARQFAPDSKAEAAAILAALRETSNA